MEALIPLAVAAAVVVFSILFLFRSRRPQHQPTYATTDEIRSIVAKLQRTGHDGSFVVFMFSLPNEHDQTLPNFQYSIENGRLGFDWVLIAPRNVEDETRVSDFVKRLGFNPSVREMNDVRYIRVEGEGIEDIGPKLLRDFYHLRPEAKLELIVEGFDA